MKQMEVLKVRSLQLFAEGGEGAAEGGQAAEQSAPQAQEGTQTQEGPREQAANRQYALWAQQAEQARQLYPNLDMNTEAKNPRFRQLLRSGVDVASAYLVIHQQEILPAAMRHTARVVEQKLVDKFLSSGGRPVENGISAQAPAVSKTDVSKLTRAERAEIRKRAAMGVKIRF
ncbi:MAG: hypothetical protein ACI4PH_08670 [Faecousia sp.]